MSSLLILKIYRVWKLVYSVDCWYLETRNQISGSSWRTCSRILSTHWHTDTLNHRITWAEQTHGPQPLLTHLSLQTLHHLHSPPWRLYHADSSRSRCSGTKACSSSKVGVNETQRTHRWWWLWRSCPIYPCHSFLPCPESLCSHMAIWSRKWTSLKTNPGKSCVSAGLGFALIQFILWSKTSMPSQEGVAWSRISRLTGAERQLISVVLPA